MNKRFRYTPHTIKVTVEIVKEIGVESINQKFKMNRTLLIEHLKRSRDGTHPGVVDWPLPVMITLTSRSSSDSSSHQN